LRNFGADGVKFARISITKNRNSCYAQSAPKFLKVN
jgi:hypothetical protein